MYFAPCGKKIPYVYSREVEWVSSECPQRVILKNEPCLQHVLQRCIHVCAVGESGSGVSQG